MRAVVEEAVDLRDDVEGDLLLELLRLVAVVDGRSPSCSRTARPSPPSRRRTRTGRWTRRRRVARPHLSCSGFSATTSWIVLQFGLATIRRLANFASACGFTSGTTSGTSGSMRKWLVLSITAQPAAAARGACTAEIAAPGLNRPMSVSEKSNVSRLPTFSTVLSPNETGWPGRARRGERHDLRHRELPLGQRLQQLAPDRSGGADDRDPVAHDRKPSAKLRLIRRATASDRATLPPTVAPALQARPGAPPARRPGPAARRHARAGRPAFRRDRRASVHVVALLRDRPSSARIGLHTVKDAQGSPGSLRRSLPY